MLACAGYFGFFGRKRVGPMLTIFFLTLFAGSALYFGEQTRHKLVIELFRGNSHFGRLQVVDGQNTACRYYLNDNLIQNTYDPERKQSESAFTYLLSTLARAYTSNINDVLCIGLGIGVVPMDFASQGARVIGLSALMTTTMAEMQKAKSCGACPCRRGASRVRKSCRSSARRCRTRECPRRSDRSSRRRSRARTC